MIKINVEKYCENCPDFKVEQDTSCAESIDGEIRFTTHILTCVHKNACAQIFKYAKQYEIN